MTEDFNNDIGTIFKNFIGDFVLKEKQEILAQFFNKEINWWKLKNEFHSSSCFDPNNLVGIKPSEQYARPIYAQMKELGATDKCLSFLDYLDNKEYQFDLKMKLTDSVGFLIETILYCPKSKVGYFEGGHAIDRYILKSKN